MSKFVLEDYDDDTQDVEIGSDDDDCLPRTSFELCRDLHTYAESRPEYRRVDLTIWGTEMLVRMLGLRIVDLRTLSRFLAEYADRLES